MTDLFAYPHTPGAKARDTSRAEAAIPGAIHDNVAERFWKKVAIGDQDQCWLWTGSISGPRPDSLYGQLQVDRRLVGAHRVSWMLSFGAIDRRLEVCHRCDNPACVNPSHLFLGTHVENMQDALQKGRIRLPDTVGEANAAAILTSDDVVAIRSSGATLSQLASSYGVSKTTISDAQRGKTWSHLPGGRKQRHYGGAKGERHPRAKLSADDVRTIRASNDRHADVARRFSVSPGLVLNIRARRVWKSVG